MCSVNLFYINGLTIKIVWQIFSVLHTLTRKYPIFCKKHLIFELFLCPKWQICGRKPSKVPRFCSSVFDNFFDVICRDWDISFEYLVSLFWCNNHRQLEMSDYTIILSPLVESISAYNQERFLCNPYLYKNEVPLWFAVQVGSVAESVTTKQHHFSGLCKFCPDFLRKNRFFGKKLIMSLIIFPFTAGILLCVLSVPINHYPLAELNCK